MADGQGSFDPPGPDIPSTEHDPLPVDTPAPPSPEPVFDGSGGINTASQDWTFILADSGLRPPSPTLPGIALTSSFFWDATFAASENGARIDRSLNSADAGDGSMVLGLLSPSTGEALASPMRFADVKQKFGISPDNTPHILQTFIDAVDSSGTFALVPDTARETRNALWAVPGQPGDPYQVVVTIAFQIQDSGALAQIESFINTHFGLAINISPLKPRMVFTKQTFYTRTLSGSPRLIVSSAFSLTISTQVDTFELSATFTPTGLDLLLSDPRDTTPPGSIIERLASAVFKPSSVNPSSGDIPNSQSPGPFNSSSSSPTIDLWYLSIEKTVTDWTTSSPPEPVYGPTYWQIGLLGGWRTALLGLFYDSRTSAFTGELLFSTAFPNPIARRQYNYNWQTDLPLATRNRLTGLPAFLNLWSMFSGSTSPPSGLPTEVHEAKISYRRDQTANSSTLGITASAINPPPAGSVSDAAPHGFSWDTISVAAVINSAPQGDTTDIQIFTAFSLNPPAGAAVKPATLRINMEYFSGSFWFLHGRVENLSVALLYDYFAGDIKESAISALGSLNLRSLDMLYTFQENGGPSSFLMTAVLVLGELELDLSYQYVSGLVRTGESTAAQIAWPTGTSASGVVAIPPTGSGSSWLFEADLGSSSPGSTVGSVVNSISANAAGSLPAFVADISLAPKSGGKDFVKLTMEGGKGVNTILTVWLTIADFSLTFISLPTANGKVKRVVRISCDEIPLVKDIPLIKDLPQPFDKLLYLWLDDDTQAGLSGAELEAMNDELTLKLKVPEILVQHTNGSLPTLQAGHHFMVTNKSEVVLDHRFNTSNGPQANSLIVTDHSARSLMDAAAPTEDAPPSKGKIDKQLPFLSISAVSLQVKNPKSPKLAISLDATVTLGPIAFTVIGFEIDLDLTKITLDHLERLLAEGLSVTIHGLAVKIDKAPLLIAGVFIHETVSEGGVIADIYKGGLALGFEKWQFLAVGEYQEVKEDGHEFKSVFIFAKLDGPLITLAFATISGVRVGFGYNSIVRSPAVKELPQFPFLSDSVSSAGNDPMKILISMTTGSNGTPAWVSRKEDSYWVAAGLTMTAFGILSVTAVLMLGFRNSGVVISVFADGVAQMPPGVSPDATLFYVEVGMLAELNTVDGYFTVQAALAPTSHVLVSSCRLMGGFALVNWFSPNAHSGDFVFTVGGFHRAYTPPTWYPVPDRLGISFTLGDMINVTGTVYFAITPKCVMGGGSLHLGLDVGPVSAWLDVILDVFIQFKPFHYMADLSVSVGCAITINVWFVHVRISISVGAALHIEGPDPFGGTADVDFYLFSFTIHFGGRPPLPPPAGLQEFYDMVLTPGPPSDAPAGTDPAAADPMKTRLKFTLSSGLYPFPSTGAVATWQVKAGTFSCIVGCDFALSGASILQFEDTTNPSNNTSTDLHLPDTTGPLPSFYSKPMHLTTPVTSKMTISIYKFESDGSKTLVPFFSGTLTMKDVPAALWGSYDPNADPARAPNPSALKDPSQPTLRLCMGVTLNPPPPILNRSTVQKMDITAAFRRLLGPFLHPAIPMVQSTLLSEVAYPADVPTERWSKVRSAWKDGATNGKSVLEDKANSEGTKEDGFFTLAAKMLGWDSPPPGTSREPDAGGRKPWDLVGGLPTKLVEGLDTTYGVLPRFRSAVAVAVGA